MKKTAATIISAVASFILILCIVFTSVQLVINDDVFMENELKKTDTAASMGVSSYAVQVPALHSLLEYMQGRADSINPDDLVLVNGEYVQMFELEIEQVHMEEVQTVWLALVNYRNIGLALAFVLFVLSIIICGKGALGAILRGYLFGLAGFALLGAFVGTWAAADFDAFWVFFHRTIFPASNNWLLPASSRMIQMLPTQFFSDVIVRICMFAVTAIVFIGIVDVIILLLGRKRKSKEEIIEDDSIEIIEPEGPDILAVYKNLNLPVSQRDKVDQNSDATEEE
ncbi:MAG: DUF1461 domain-containing protein [Eubacteriales bacterium]|nr:DUF1461 domain-containing protein [Eubacteriales bacterium]